MNKRNTGFTLLELMMVVVIVGALAAIAIPNYMDYLRKTRRNDTMAVLQQFANAMERYRLANGNYTGADDAGVPGIADADIFPAQAPLDGTPKYYDLTIQVLTPNTYTLRAAPILVNAPPAESNAQATDGIIELDSTGAKRWDEDNSGVPPFDANENDWDPG